jgi:hypothetical protein
LKIKMRLIAVLIASHDWPEDNGGSSLITFKKIQ